MPSPFPGMDPFIEGQRWPDFHTTFITIVREMLMPRVRPRYVVEVEEYVYLARGEEDPDRLVEPDLALSMQRTTGRRNRPTRRHGAGRQTGGPHAAGPQAVPASLSDDPQPRVSECGHGHRGVVSLEQGIGRGPDGIPSQADQSAADAGSPGGIGSPSRRPTPADPRAVDAGRLLRVCVPQGAAASSRRLCVDAPAAAAADSDPACWRRS